jgi:hypothetical protein
MYSMCRSSAVSGEAQVSKALSAYCNYQHANTWCSVQAKFVAQIPHLRGPHLDDIVSQHFAHSQQCTCFALAGDGCVSLSAKVMFALCADGICRTMYRIQWLYSGYTCSKLHTDQTMQMGVAVIVLAHLLVVLM